MNFTTRHRKLLKEVMAALQKHTAKKSLDATTLRRLQDDLQDDLPHIGKKELERLVEIACAKVRSYGAVLLTMCLSKMSPLFRF
jgi:hypothetical protein